ncbi:MAG: ABC transporter permease subunit [Coprobacillus sp.]
MTLPLYMYNEVIGLLDFGKGATIGLVLMIPAFIAFVIDLLQKETSSLSFVSEKYLVIKNRLRDLIANIWSILLSIVLILPIATFILLMFLKKYPINLSFSLEHISRAMDMGLSLYLKNSVIIALLTSFLGVSISYITAYFTARTKGKQSKLLHLISMISLAIPGIVLGLSYVLFFKSTPIYGMIIILVLVNSIHFFASPYLMAYNGLGKLNSNYEDVARTLGISRWRLIKDVLIPQTLETILEMFSYFFVNSMVTISAVSFLSTRDIQPLSLMIPNLESMMLIESISFVSIVILVVNLVLKVIIYLIKKIVIKVRKKGEVYNMGLNRKEFSVLVLLEKSGNSKYTQREISESLDMSLGSSNATIQSLIEKGYVDEDNKITESGKEALEPYRVKKAVFIAAGFGSRLVPLTINSPKPLIRVNGTRMIDTLLDAVVEAGIEEIYVVRGYLREQFDQLLYKYPQIKFIDNPYYNEANNISSAMCARHLLQNAYVLEADLVLYNSNLITKYQYTSNYLGVKTDMTDDWCFQTDKNKVIKKLLVGGRNVYHMYGISYWNEKDGAQLEEDIKKTYELPGGKERYWDQVSLEYFKNNYKLEVRECTFEDIIEIDSYADLKKIDKHYSGGLL